MIKRKKCKNCLKMFTPERAMQSCCSFECSIEWAKKPKAQKQYKMEKKKELIEKYPDKSKWLANAQTVVNAYVRLRDKNKPCISCGYIGDGKKWNAGHFRPQGGNQQLRFNLLNLHKQCEPCNSYKSGNLVPYRKALIKKFGIKWVENLESNHETKKYSIEYLQRLIKVFRKKIKLYEKKFR